MIKNKDHYLTTFEVAQKIGVTPDHIRRLIMQGKIKAEKLGNNWLVKPASIKNITRQRKPKNGK